MVDLPPTAVASASSATSSSSGGPGGGGANLHSAATTVVNLPDSLQSTSQNVTLGARLVGANADGSVVLRTAQGDVTLQLPINVQPGNQLQLQVTPGSPPVVMLLYTDTEQQVATNYVNSVINNLKLPTVDFGVADTTGMQAALQTGIAVRAVVVDAQIVAAIPMVPNNSPLGELLTKPGALTDLLEKIASGGGDPTSIAQAQLLSQLGSPGRLPDQIGQLSLSGRLLETVQQTVQLLQSQPGGAQGLSNNQGNLQSLQLAGQSSPATSGMQNAAVQGEQLIAQGGGNQGSLPPNTILNLQITQIILPGALGSQAQQTGAVAGNTNIITGQLTSQIINGQPVVQTPQGLLLLQANSKLPPGTTLIFEILPDNAALAVRGAVMPDEEIKTISTLPHLETALLTLGVDNESMAAVMNSIPKLNGMFPASALFFMQAVQTGNIKNWLGDKALQALGASGPGGAKLLAELQREFGSIGAKADSTKPGEWRQITIPYMGEYGIATARMAVRDHYPEINPEERRRQGLPKDAGRVTRFLFDVEFSEFGSLQVDGLLRPGADAQNQTSASFKKQLDILLRTRELLPAPMRRELMDMYSESLGAYGMNGTLAFQAGYQNWIRLAEERSSAHKGSQI